MRKTIRLLKIKGGGKEKGVIHALPQGVTSRGKKGARQTGSEEKKKQHAAAELIAMAKRRVSIEGKKTKRANGRSGCTKGGGVEKNFPSAVRSEKLTQHLRTPNRAEGAVEPVGP